MNNDNDFVKIIERTRSEPRSSEQIEATRKHLLRKGGGCLSWGGKWTEWDTGDSYGFTLDGKWFFVPGPYTKNKATGEINEAKAHKRPTIKELVIAKTPKFTTMFDGRFPFGVWWKFSFNV